MNPLLFLITLFCSYSVFGAEIQVRCTGKSATFYNNKFVNVSEKDITYIFYDKQLFQFGKNDKKSWWYETNEAGSINLFTPMDKQVSSNGSVYEKTINVSDGLISIYFHSKQSDDETTKREQINRMTGQWIVKTTRSYVFQGQKVRSEDNIDGKCIKGSKKF